MNLLLASQPALHKESIENPLLTAWAPVQSGAPGWWSRATHAAKGAFKHAKLGQSAA